MKVIQVIGGGERGGSRNHIVALCQGLQGRGVDVELVCFLDDAVAGAARSSVRVTVLPMRGIFDLKVVRGFGRYLAERKPDIVHTHGVRANFIGRLAARRAGVPVVTTVHSSIYHDYAHPLKKLFYHRIEKLTRPWTNRFIAVAGSLRKELEADGVDPRRIEVVYNAIAPEIQVGAKPAPFLRAALGIPAGMPVVMTVGRMESVKNQAMLLQVFSRLKQDGVPFHGVLVGDGPLMPELRALTGSLGLEADVSFLGFRTDVVDLLGEADLFVLTSKMEGLPITLLEAMAAHTPVVVTDTGGMPEIVRLAGNGYVVPVGDVEQFAARIREILVQPDLKEELGQNGCRTLRQSFLPEHFVAHTMEVYQRVLT